MFFDYDPGGNRVGMQVITDRIDYTWYVRDAQGNVMAVYTNFRSTPFGAPLDTLRLAEHHVYGSSRLGVIEGGISMARPKAAPINASLIGASCLYTAERGRTAYELSNHLGNVLVTVSDKKIGVPSVFSTSLIQYYLAYELNASDYYPFGMVMPGRRYSADATYRYGFNGQEKDSEIAGDANNYSAEFWQYDPRLGRRWNIDPIDKEWESPYAAFANNPIWHIDPTGADTAKYLTNGQLVDAVKIARKVAQKVAKIKGADFHNTAYMNEVLKSAQDYAINNKLSLGASAEFVETASEYFSLYYWQWS